MSYVTIPFSCVRDGLTIRGFAYEPNERTLRYPVVMCHGLGGTMEEPLPYAAYLAERGVCSYLFDFIGGSYDTSSDGDYEHDMTPIAQVEDLRCVLDLVATREQEKPVILGCSQGGLVCGLAAGWGAAIRALALIYPAFSIPDDARAGHFIDFVFDPHDIPDALSDGTQTISGDYMRSIIDLDAIAEAAAYTGDVFIAHGTADALIPFAYAERAKAAFDAAGASCELHPIVGAPHYYREGPALDETCALLEAWLRTLS